MTNASRLSRRTFIMNSAAAAAGATAIGSILEACGPSNSAKVTLVWWDWFISQAPWLDNEIKLFQQAHPNITISKNTQAVDKYPDLFALAVQGQSEPDVFMIPQKPTTIEQVQKGWLRPLDTYATSSWQQRWVPGTFHEGSDVFGGKVYSAPLTGVSPWCQTYFNDAVFKAAGVTNADGSIKIPQTWDDLTNAADTITKKGNGNTTGFIIGNKEGNELLWLMHQMSLSAGAPGGAFGQDWRTGLYTFGSDRAYTDVIELLLEWKKRGIINDNVISLGDEVAKVNFSQGKGGIITGGVWIQSPWQQAGFTDFSLNTLISPSGKPQAYFNYSPGNVFAALSPKTKHPDEAFLWLDWLYSVDAGKRLVEYGVDVSVFPQNNDAAALKTNKGFAQYIGLAKLSIPGPDPTIRNPDVGKVKIAGVSPGMSDIINGIYSGQLGDVKAALTDLQDRSNQALNDGIKAAQAQGINVTLNDYIFSDWDPTKPYVTKPKA